MSAVLTLDPKIYEFDTQNAADEYTEWLNNEVRKSTFVAHYQRRTGNEPFRCQPSKNYWSASKMQINWSEQALSEVENIVNYIAEHNVVAALEMDDLIRNSVMILKQMPRAGRYGRVANTRELVIHRNYIVIYEIGLDSITILNVKHASQKYP